MNGSYVPGCWNPHVRTLGWVAYGLVGVELVCAFLFNRWLHGRLEGAGHKVADAPPETDVKVLSPSFNADGVAA